MKIKVLVASVLSCTVVLTAAPTWPPSTSFSAHGSAEQVYVTGLAPTPRPS